MIYNILTIINTIALILLVFTLKQWVKLIVKKDFHIFKIAHDEKTEIIQTIQKLLFELEELQTQNLSEKNIVTKIEKKYKEMRLNINKLSSFSTKKTMTLLNNIFSEKSGIKFIYKLSAINPKVIEKLKITLKNEIK